jgi:hypothetical protein
MAAAREPLAVGRLEVKALVVGTSTERSFLGSRETRQPR